MKSIQMAPLLVGVLLCLSLCAALLAFRYWVSQKRLETLQSQYLRMNNTVKAAQSLAAQCVQYGKKNPEINSILKQFILNPASNAIPGLAQPNPASTEQKLP